jgi:serine-type D-Ala-D-Ala carboxypeptidase/endopeptidase (penicillin-binding protein 4)
MARSIVQKLLWVAVIAASVFSSASAQPGAPLLQDIKVYGPSPTPVPRASSTPAAQKPIPLVQKTGASTPAVVPTANSIRTMFPALMSLEIPGYSGVIVETLDGKTVIESNPGFMFNPASNVKTGTSYAVLKTFGPEFRFGTNVYTDGALDQATGNLIGNIYVSGKDPMFGYEHAIMIAHELNRAGVKTVTGDLIVTDNFAMNYSGSALKSAQTLFATLNYATRPAAATRNWLTYLQNSGKMGTVMGMPSISFAGKTYVQGIPSNLHLIFTHESAPLKEIVKVTMCYSNNFLSERLGDMLGGPYAVAQFVRLNAGIPANEYSLASASGLGYNRVTPNAQMKLLRAFRNELARYKMTFADVMPVAGIDRGTLEERFDNDFAPGSVVGKTGTLGQTDAGVSSLAGEINTNRGKLLFVIFNQKGSPARFRSFQNYFVSLIQAQFGGPASLGYQPASLDVRLARSRITYPQQNNRGGGE